MSSLSRCLALASRGGAFPSNRVQEPEPGGSIAPLEIGQNFFDQPAVADVHVEANWARPGVGAFALSATATDNNFGVLARRVLKWLS